ncbi:MAG: tRNA 2-selenouridine(34) synthase MnmH [Chitinophagaceae bacterium]|nr:MAG: tRNA 2-selenouridine(34) synthase MnmH [Chitinophagaceae bacterium]
MQSVDIDGQSFFCEAVHGARLTVHDICRVPIHRHPIADFLERSRGALLYDVRSPGEYAHARMPGAVNLPLFNDEQRAQVGTAYKQVSREHAIKIGLDAFGPQMRTMVESVERALRRQGLDNTTSICLYCWRGGMRSGAVAWLLGLYGFDVHVLEGGYKAFRNWALEQFGKEYPFRIVGGFTGAGKTELLHRLQLEGEQVIDLEGLARHKGSAFGSIGMPAQPTQEQFENLLALQLDVARSRLSAGGLRLWIEDESQRIGQVHLPHTLWATLQKAPISFVDIPFAQRLQHLVEEYGVLDKERLREAIVRITRRLGGQHAKAALEFLDEGQFTDCFSILLHYYDKLYAKGLEQRAAREQLVHTISCADVSNNNALKLIAAT